MQATIEKIELKHDRLIDFASFKSLQDTESFNKKITYSQFIQSLQEPKITTEKGGAGGFVGGYVKDSRKKSNVQTRSMITIDIDDASDIDVWGNVEAYTNFAALLYSSHNSTPSAPRYRLIIPLKQDIKPAQYEAVTRFLVNMMHLDIDETSYQFERIMFYPTCENEDNYQFYYQDFPFFDPSGIVQQSKDIQSFTTGDFKKRDPRTKQNWVGAWCNVYSITDVLHTFLNDVYKPHTGDRYTYIEGSTKGGLCLYDDGQHAHSNHSTDPISGMNVNSFDLFRLHKYGDLDNGTEEIKDKPSYKAMIEYCKRDEAVKAYYDEHIGFEIHVSNEDKTIEVDASKFFDEKDKFQHHKFACYLVKEWNIISLDDRLHIYTNGKYTADDTRIKRLIVTAITSLKINQIREVMERLKLVAPIKEHADPRYIGVKNGVYDLVENRLLDHSPEIVITNQINADYNPDAICQHVEDMLELISNNDKEITQLIKEMIGYTFYRENSLEKAFLFKGEGGNGKSTLFNAISSLLGEENVSALSLSDLGERFNTGLLNGKLANIGDDIPYTSIKDTSIFKKLSTGNTVKGEFKGETAFYFRSFAKLIFATNRMPRLYDNSQGLKDRLVIIPLNARIRDTNKQDIFFEQKITTGEARSYLLNVGIKALNELLARGHFITPSAVKREVEAFEVTNNPVAEWLNDYEEEGKDIHRMPVDSAYGDYKNFCSHNGYLHPLSKKALSVELVNHGYESDRRYTSSEGKTVRVYLKTDEALQKDASENKDYKDYNHSY